MRSGFFYTIITAFMGGIFTRSFFEISASGIIFFLILGSAFFVVWRVRKGETTSFVLLSLACVAFAIGAGRLAYEESNVSLLLPYEGKEISIIGRIVREKDVRETTQHLYIEVKQDGRSERVLVTADKFNSTVGFGDTVEVRGMIKEPAPFVTDTGRSFDYAHYLRTRGVMMTMSFADVKVLSRHDSFLTRMYEGKGDFLDVLERVLPEPSAGLGEGMLLGVRRALGSELERTFRETGIIHIVVLSGYNIMIVVAALMYLLSYIFFPRVRLVVGLATIVLFVLLVGPSATVVRASLMASLLLLAQVTGRTYAVLRALFLAAAIMLLVNPYLLVHDPGFQLSFVATLGLILLAPHFEERFTFVTKRVGMRNIVAATISTQILELPLLLYHTGLFSAVALPVNILVLPAVPVAMLLTFLTGLAGTVSLFLGGIFGFFSHIVLSYIVSVAELFAQLPSSSVILKEFPFWMMLVSYIIIGIGIARFIKKKESKVMDDLADWTIVEEEYVARDPIPFR